VDTWSQSSVSAPAQNPDGSRSLKECEQPRHWRSELMFSNRNAVLMSLMFVHVPWGGD
jgi:hypothetical protein